MEKYSVDNIFKPIQENYDAGSIRGGSIVVVNNDALQNPEIQTKILTTKGQQYLL